VLLLMNPLEVLMKKITCGNEISEKTTCKKIYIKKGFSQAAGPTADDGGGRRWRPSNLPALS
jgi:hypothetical protein